MENMTQQDKKRIEEYKLSIANHLEGLTDKLYQYHTIGATLSEETLMKVNAYLMAAERSLESGFVKDACKEIDDYFKTVN